jgi:hypothetical protein
VLIRRPGPSRDERSDAVSEAHNDQQPKPMGSGNQVHSAGRHSSISGGHGRTSHASGDSHRFNGSRNNQNHYSHHHRRTSDLDNSSKLPPGALLMPDGGNMDLSNFAFPESVNM